MELTDLRKQIDDIDEKLIALLEARMDVAAGVAEYKMARGLPVLDAGRETQKLDAVRARCRPETADGIAAVFSAVMAASRARQTALMEARHGG